MGGINDRSAGRDYYLNGKNIPGCLLLGIFRGLAVQATVFSIALTGMREHFKYISDTEGTAARALESWCL